MWQERRCNHQRQEVWPQEITKREAQQKACPNTTPKPFKNQFSTSPGPPKSRFRRSRGGKIRPGGVPDKVSEDYGRPRRIQEPPKRAREPFKSAQKPAKWRPRASQEGPRPLQNRAWRAPRRVLSATCAKSSGRQAPASNFAGLKPRVYCLGCM